MSLELKLHTDLQQAIPQIIRFNFEEIKAELTTRLDYYNKLVVTEDTIKGAKADKALLNKFRTALEDQRKAVKKACLEPYADFEAKIKELVAMIDAPIGSIDQQVKGFDDIKKAEKLQQIAELYEAIVPEEHWEIIPLKRIANPKWTNTTYQMKKIEEEMRTITDRVKLDLLTLATVKPQDKAAVYAKYMETLDIGRAIVYQNELKEAQEAIGQATGQQEQPAQEQVAPQQENARTEPQGTPEKMYNLTLAFRLTKRQAEALKGFLAANDIQYEKI